MRVAVASERGTVFGHFGRCREFTLAEVEGTQVRTLEALEFEGQECDERATALAEHGVKALICGGIGAGALAHFSSAGITVYGGITGPIAGVLEQFAAGNLQAIAAACEEHHGHGRCHRG